MSVLTNHRAICAVLAASLALALPTMASAHERTIELASYGPFAEGAQCQESISRATRKCFEAAARAHLRCAETKLNGESCSVDIAPIIARTSSIIDEGCGDGDLMCRVVGYVSKEEAKADLTLACQEQSEALLSIIYGPAMFSGDVAPGPEARDRCLRVVSRYGYKIARSALRERGKAFVEMGRNPSIDTEAEKLQLLADAEARVERLRSHALALIEARCTTAEFDGSYAMTMGALSSNLIARGDCVAAASHVVDAVSCPSPVCGNAVKESNEVCDDGNLDNSDACDDTCNPTDCESFASTYDLIQNAIFEDKGCTDTLCHAGPFPAVGLDLTAPHSYENLVGAASTGSPLLRVERHLTETSFLYLKLAAATLGRTGVPGSPMPQGLPPLTPEELEAVRLWIYAGAPRTGVVDETAEKLDACLPPPDPIQAEPPPPPAPGEGVQLLMPPLEILSGKENEVCIASYYDLSGQFPEGVETVYGAFRYNKKVETQDPLSHHLIIHSYLGDYGPHDGVCKGGAADREPCDSTVPNACGAGSECENFWGDWTCKGGARAGEPCDPKNDTCGHESLCGGSPERTVACIGYGPPDYSALTAPAFGGSQQPLAVSHWADGVYSEIPVKGVMVWNSHHFNLTARPAQVRAWVNFDFAPAAEQQFPVQGGILDPDNRIFVMNVPPFSRRRYCHDFTFPQGARLFEISSHMHKRGKLFEIRDPANALVYRSTQYNDPIQLTYEEPIPLDSANEADRTYHYCAEYDNGLSDPAEVKKRSVSPPPPPPFPPDFKCNATHCVDPSGLTAGAACTGSTQAQRDENCAAQIPGATCDACNLVGGVTTEDEMFLFLAYYYCSPDFPDTCKNEYGFLPGSGNR